MPSTGPQSNSSLYDTRAHRGTVGEFLKSENQPGSHLSFVSAYLCNFIKFSESLLC
jgi:hypothetical protein